MCIRFCANIVYVSFCLACFACAIVDGENDICICYEPGLQMAHGHRDEQTFQTVISRI